MFADVISVSVLDLDAPPSRDGMGGGDGDSQPFRFVVFRAVPRFSILREPPLPPAK